MEKKTEKKNKIEKKRERGEAPGKTRPRPSQPRTQFPPTPASRAAQLVLGPAARPARAALPLPPFCRRHLGPTCRCPVLLLQSRNRDEPSFSDRINPEVRGFPCLLAQTDT